MSRGLPVRRRRRPYSLRLKKAAKQKQSHARCVGCPSEGPKKDDVVVDASSSKAEATVPKTTEKKQPTPDEDEIRMTNLRKVSQEYRSFIDKESSKNDSDSETESSPDDQDDLYSILGAPGEVAPLPRSQPIPGRSSSSQARNSRPTGTESLRLPIINHSSTDREDLQEFLSMIKQVKLFKERTRPNFQTPPRQSQPKSSEQPGNQSASGNPESSNQGKPKKDFANRMVGPREYFSLDPEDQDRAMKATAAFLREKMEIVDKRHADKKGEAKRRREAQKAAEKEEKEAYLERLLARGPDRVTRSSTRLMMANEAGFLGNLGLRRAEASGGNRSGIGVSAAAQGPLMTATEVTPRPRREEQKKVTATPTTTTATGGTALQRKSKKKRTVTPTSTNMQLATRNGVEDPPAVPTHSRSTSVTAGRSRSRHSSSIAATTTPPVTTRRGRGRCPLKKKTGTGWVKGSKRRVEAILNHVYFPGRIFYEVKWEGCNSEDTHWIEEVDFLGSKQIVKDYWKEMAKKGVYKQP